MKVSRFRRGAVRVRAGGGEGSDPVAVYLSAALCSAGRMREERECYARALEMSGASEPSPRSEIESALRTAEAQITGELPSGDAVLFDADGVQMVLETDEGGGMRTRAL